MAKNLLKTKAKDPTDAVFGVNQEGDCVHKSLAEMVHTLIAGTTGCHAKGELILMADGTSKPVELINGGDRVMGGDGTPRTVLTPRWGEDAMYELDIRNRGTLKVNGEHKLILFNPNWSGNHERVVTVNEYLKLPPYAQSRSRMCLCAGIESFERATEQIIDPYIVGIFIGDDATNSRQGGCPNITTADQEVVDAIYEYAGKIDCSIRVDHKPGNAASTYVFARDPENYTVRNRSVVNNFTDQIRSIGLDKIGSGEKFIPDDYKYADISVRRELFAGLMDSDGYLNRNKMYDFVTKSKRLADDVTFVGRSLGLQVHVQKCQKGIKSIGFVGDYYRLGISGNLDEIPVRIPRKKYAPAKKGSHSSHRATFTITKIADRQKYYGFTCDGDHTYLTQSMVRTCNSGKSVYVNSLLISAMSHATPDELKIFAIDPKKVEFSKYIDLPYCPINPVTDMRDAYGLLAFAVWEMERRYKIIQAAGVKQLSEYNDFYDKNPDNEVAKKYGRMPYMIFVIDEYAELQSISPNTETLCKSLAQKGRASGIILLLATQRPSADVISTTLRSNFPSRICLKVDNSTSSQIVLGDGVDRAYDGSKLKGYGDSFVLDQRGNCERVQGIYISNEEIDAIFDFLKEKYADRYDELRKYVPDEVYDLLTEDSKKAVGLNGGVCDYKILTTDKEACAFVDRGKPFCKWVGTKGEGGFMRRGGDVDEQSPSALPDHPEKWHVESLDGF